MRIVYLDTSAIIKRYVQESGSEVVASIYSKAWLGEGRIAFSLWNIGEALGVLDKYYRRGWLTSGDYELARREFLGETLKMLRLRLLSIIPLKPSLIVESWKLVEKHRIYQADALQIASSKLINAEEFYTADEVLCEVADEEKLNTRCLV
jgi:predicted nucleic acid-binding protein